ncbi:hypothetical protein CFP56_029280 [Quercus suber]|uniref:Uncharacterized protein n=1 Tax=Quercus suber TaxID=58331 RepID=A0AAW0ME54_QUESU
MEFQFFFKDL